MAKYWLLNSVSSGRRQHWAGDSIDDTITPADVITALGSAGGVLVLQGDATLDAAAAKVQARRKGRSINETEATDIMAGAMDSTMNRFVSFGRSAPGTALTNADETLAVAGGGYRASSVTLTGNRTKTLDTTGAVAGDQIEIMRTNGADAFTLAFVNGGVGAGTLYTMPVSKAAWAKFQFDGTNWFLRGAGLAS